MSEKRIALSDAVSNLREQLQIAMEEGNDKQLRFGIEEIELELTCSVSREADGNAGIKFWLIEAGAGAKIGSEATQTVKLKLKPVSKSGALVEVSDIDEVR